MTPSRNGCCRFPRDSDTMLPIWNSDNQLDVSGSGVADFSLTSPKVSCWLKWREPDKSKELAAWPYGA